MLYSETKAIKFGKTSGPLGVSIKMVVLTLMRKLPDLQMSLFMRNLFFMTGMILH